MRGVEVKSGTAARNQRPVVLVENFRVESIAVVVQK